MIYTLTLNPAIDYVMHTDKLNNGNILRSSNEQVFFGGKGINVSLVLSELGVPSKATGFIAGFTGDALEKGIKSQNIDTDFVRLGNGLTRINIKIRAQEETDINASGPIITAEDIEKLYIKLESLKNGDILVLAGSVPKTVSSDIYQKIMERLSNKEIKFVVDAERDLLINSLRYKPFLIKPNNQELGEIFGEKISTHERAIYFAKQLKEKGALNVLVSMGAYGAVLLDQNDCEHFIRAKAGKVINTVGAGDSMVAGFIAGYIKEKNYDYALNLGNACGSATALSMGLAKREEIIKLL